jgi:hypothetical protein
MRTIAELAQEALDIQDACNPLGLSKGYARSLQELADNLRATRQESGTDAVRCHPINQLWVAKLAELSGLQILDLREFSFAIAECRELAKQPA